MNLKVKFALISGLPLLGLCVAILASYLLAQSIEHKTRLARDKNVTFADCARRMQIDVVQVQQWLTDISATRGQDGLDDGFKEAEESHKSFLANLNKFRAEFQLEQNDEELRKLADLEKNFEAYYEKGRIMAAAYIKDGPTAGNQIMSEFDATASLLTETLTPFVDAEVEKFHTALMGISDFTHSTSQWMALGGLVIILLAVTFTYIQIRSIKLLENWPQIWTADLFKPPPLHAKFLWPATNSPRVQANKPPRLKRPAARWKRCQV